MPRSKRILTPRPTNKCWRKFYRGRYYYVGQQAENAKGENPWLNGNYTGRNTDCVAYKQAVAEWEVLKAEIDSKSNPSPASAFALSDAYAKHGGVGKGAGGELPTSQFTPEQISILRSSLPPEQLAAFGISPALAAADAVSAGPAVNMATDYSGDSTSLDSYETLTLADGSIAKAIETYLGEKQQEVSAGNLSPKMYAEHSGKLDDFRQFAEHKQRFDLNQLDTPLLKAYRAKQLHLTTLPTGKEVPKKERGVSKPTARKRLQCVRRFVEWAYATELLESLPRVVLKGYDALKLDKPKPEFYEINEVREIFKAAPPLLRAAILLACNTGAYQTDVASLEWGMIDLKTRIVSRERGKTGVLMEHRLWPCTIEALKKVSKSKSGLVLTGKGGVPLLREEIGENGKLKIYDIIAQEFRKIQRKLKHEINGRGFSTLRNTGSNLIEQNFSEKPWLADQWLGHSIGGMKQHYASPNFDACLEACDWLGEQFKLDEC